MSDGNEVGTASSWDAAYESNSAPWDIGRPQPVWIQLANAGEIRPPVLDSGCGTGEQALMLAERGLQVLGVDISPVAIRTARAKAKARGLDAAFEVADVLALDRLDHTFATIIDSGVFHVFDDPNRTRYVASLAGALGPGGVVHLLCFSEHTPGDAGPRRVTQAELRAAFAHDWRVERIEPAVFEVREQFAPGAPQAWLAHIIRLGQE